MKSGLFHFPLVYPFMQKKGGVGGFISSTPLYNQQSAMSETKPSQLKDQGYGSALPGQVYRIN
jgi:hypothetical protein